MDSAILFSSATPTDKFELLSRTLEVSPGRELARFPIFSLESSATVLLVKFPFVPEMFDLSGELVERDSEVFILESFDLRTNLLILLRGAKISDAVFSSSAVSSSKPSKRREVFNRLRFMLRGTLGALAVFWPALY